VNTETVTGLCIGRRAVSRCDVQQGVLTVQGGHGCLGVEVWAKTPTSRLFFSLLAPTRETDISVEESKWKLHAAEVVR
jgi:hypothetical protein